MGGGRSPTGVPTEYRYLGPKERNDFSDDFSNLQERVTFFAFFCANTLNVVQMHNKIVNRFACTFRVYVRGYCYRHYEPEKNRIKSAFCWGRIRCVRLRWLEGTSSAFSAHVYRILPLDDITDIRRFWLLAAVVWGCDAPTPHRK